MGYTCSNNCFLFSNLAGSDYIAAVNQALVFTSESLQRQCVNVGILDDQLVEPLEQFTVRIDQTTSQGSVSNQASVLITDGTTFVI